MSVNNTNSKVVYTGDGGTQAFPFTFKVYATTDLVVTLLQISTGVTTTLVLNTGYTVALSSTAPSAGTVTTTTAPTTDQKLTILRLLPLTQLINLVDNEGTPAATYIEGYDRQAMIAQQLQEQLSRAIIQDPTQSATLSLPAAVANYLLAWNSGGTALINVLASSLGALIKAGKTDAEAGTDDAKYMTPLQVVYALLKSGLYTVPEANIPQITTADKVSGTALTGLASIPAGAGVIPSANLPTATLSTEIGYFNKSVQDSSGAVSVSIGFKPSFILFFSNIEGGNAAHSVGAANQAKGCFAAQSYAGIGTTSVSTIPGGNVSQLTTDSGAGGIFSVTSFDTNGVTLQWDKSGSPSAVTAYVVWVAFR